MTRLCFPPTCRNNWFDFLVRLSFVFPQHGEIIGLTFWLLGYSLVMFQTQQGHDEIHSLDMFAVEPQLEQREMVARYINGKGKLDATEDPI